MGKIYSVKEVAEILGTHPDAIYRLINLKQMQAVIINADLKSVKKHYRITEEEVERFINSRITAQLEMKPTKGARPVRVKVKDHFVTN